MNKDMTNLATATPVPHRRRRLSTTERRVEIVAAAIEIFMSQGIEQVSMRNIAAKIGLSSTAIYVHFRDKDDLLYQVTQVIFGKMGEYLTPMMAARKDPMDSLTALLRGYIEFGLAYPGEYRLLFMTGIAQIGRAMGHRPPPGGEPTPGDRGMQCFALLHNGVREVMARGLFRPGDPAAVAEVIWSAGHGLVSVLLTHEKFPWSDRNALIDTAVEMMIRGFKA